MSFNLVDLVKDQISGSLMGQMGSMLGDESSRAAGAVDSAVPALLEGLRNSTSSSSGADSLFHAVQNQDDSICLLYTSPSPRDKRQSRMPSSA